MPTEIKYIIAELLRDIYEAHKEQIPVDAWEQYDTMLKKLKKNAAWSYGIDKKKEKETKV